MENPVAILTIIENPVGDGIHTQLGLKCEFYPPIEPGANPTMAQMAAMVAVNAITELAKEAGGGISDIQTFPGHSESAGWWPS